MLVFSDNDYQRKVRQWLPTSINRESIIMASTKPLKVFNLYRCWMNNRGRNLVAANSKSEAAKLIGCSIYFLTNYSHELTTEDREEYKLAMSAPKQVFKQELHNDPYLPLNK